MSEIVHLNDSNYEAETAQGVVVVDFWAPWCCKYNVDEANEYAAKLGIRSIPTLIVYENGQPIQQHVGSMGQSQLEDFLNQFV